MSYRKDASSSDLKPVLLAVSVATAFLFGGMFFYYNSTQHLTTGEAPVEQAPAKAPAVQQSASSQAASETPVATSVKPKNRTRV